MRGDATVFTRRDEAEGEWRIMTLIEEARARLPAPRFPDYVVYCTVRVTTPELVTW